MANDMTSELGRRKRVAWGAYKIIEDVEKRTKNIWFCALLFDTTVLSALTYASETWAFRKQDRFAQMKGGIRCSSLSHRSKIRNAAASAKESKIR
ncbi:hypothetical protein RB195_022132 [Necator americanus]|uniref:PiggyBac transposable element-derived protein domain-containing protein n=1 Tax=Necator americanus TaxID=51031 RepID=A0ABR1EE38_NECAM